MSTPGPLREIIDDARYELGRRRAQLLAWLAYLAIAAGGFYLMSSTARDSGQVYDSMDRTTVAIIGLGLVGLGIALGIATLAVDQRVRRAEPTAPRRPVPLRSRTGVRLAIVMGAVLAALRVVAFTGLL